MGRGAALAVPARRRARWAARSVSRGIIEERANATGASSRAGRLAAARALCPRDALHRMLRPLRADGSARDARIGTGVHPITGWVCDPRHQVLAICKPRAGVHRCG